MEDDVIMYSFIEQIEKIHRDLKSLNIFLQEDYLAKIGDLGCAKELLPQPALSAALDDSWLCDVRDTDIERLPNDIEDFDDL